MPRINSFAGAERLYRDTKPIVSKLHTKADDIRPMGDRRRKHERIARISRNCYVLLGGYVYDGVNYWGLRAEAVPVPNDDLVRTAPIVWTRKGGKEFITVHNAPTQYASSFWDFLRRTLPGPLYLPYVRNGVYYIRNTMTRAEFYLPRNTYRVSRLNQPLPPGFGRLPRFERKLTFMRTPDGQFVPVGEHASPPRKLRRIDPAKKQLRAEIAAFRDWATIMLPVVAHAQSSANAASSLRAALQAETAKYHLDLGGTARGTTFHYAGNRALFEAAMRDENSPARMLILHELLAAVTTYRYDYHQRTSVREVTVPKLPEVFHATINRLGAYATTIIEGETE